MGVRLAALLAAVLLIGLSVGAVVGASSVPTIKACVQSGGVMRYLATGKCKSGEKLLTWNIQGPRSATGPQGPIGPQGEPGPGAGGPAAGAFYLAEDNRTSFGGGSATLVSLKVPAGSYLIDLWAILDLVKSTEPVGYATCTIAGDSDIASTPALLVTFGGRVFSLRAYAEFAAATTIRGICGGQINEQTKATQLIATAAKRLPAEP